MERVLSNGPVKQAIIKYLEGSLSPAFGPLLGEARLREDIEYMVQWGLFEDSHLGGLAQSVLELEATCRRKLLEVSLEGSFEEERQSRSQRGY